MSKMWHESSPKGYLNFRTFIMGIMGNEDIFLMAFSTRASQIFRLHSEAKQVHKTVSFPASILPSESNILETRSRSTCFNFAHIDLSITKRTSTGAANKIKSQTLKNIAKKIATHRT